MPAATRSRTRRAMHGCRPPWRASRLCSNRPTRSTARCRRGVRPPWDAMPRTAIFPAEPTTSRPWARPSSAFKRPSRPPTRDAGSSAATPSTSRCAPSPRRQADLHPSSSTNAAQSRARPPSRLELRRVHLMHRGKAPGEMACAALSLAHRGERRRAQLNVTASRSAARPPSRLELRRVHLMHRGKAPGGAAMRRAGTGQRALRDRLRLRIGPPRGRAARWARSHAGAAR